MNDATVFYFVYINYYRITVENEDRVYITCLDIIYSKGNNIRRQACWVATEKSFPFLIGKVLTIAKQFLNGKRSFPFPFLIGKVLTESKKVTR